MIPKIFDDIKNALSNFDCSTILDDGRINSVTDENNAIAILESNFTVLKPPPRWWYDVAIVDNDNVYYCNIKSSSFKTADNFSSKAAILYCFSDLPVEEIGKLSSCSWLKFENLLKEHKNIVNDRNYFMIVLNKTDGSCLIQSLKTLKKISANGNNLPFQINWNHNTDVIERTHGSSREFVLGTYKQSVKKKVEQHSNVDEI